MLLSPPLHPSLLTYSSARGIAAASITKRDACELRVRFRLTTPPLEFFEDVARAYQLCGDAEP